ncbi:hypothetical protein MKQ68_12025 [Chitinophaga horti]|uniref:Uncharacterized protein n=1 Tax=Chitinophaga horti TaxID=2920382 RepID=A0ABY6J818_9BACT|nr:hypothetical protein [Chitinophaga horti]UYQ95828.1 hypothetical protein MKQ68_12025 [Chitinophaga horti]
MCNLLRYTNLLLLWLALSACDDEVVLPEGGEGPDFVEVIRLRDYIHNLREYAPMRNQIGGTPPPSPPLNPIPLLDSLVDAALFADTIQFRGMDTAYFLPPELKVQPKVEGSTSYLDVTILCDTVTNQIRGAIVNMGKRECYTHYFDTDLIPGRRGSFRFYMQETWDYSTRKFNDNAVVWGHVGQNTITCYAMIYTNIFF